MRARRRKLIAIAAVAVAASTATAVGAGGGGQAAQREASATATAWARDASTGYVTVSGNGSRAGAGTSVTASTSGGRGRAEASASVAGVDLFGGLVTASSASATANATAAGTTTSGRVASLTINGRSVGTQTSAGTFDLDGHGTLTVLQRSGLGITAMRAKLTKAYGEHPAGSTAAVAFAEARATDAPPPPRTTPAPQAPRPPARKPRRRPRPERPARPRDTAPKPPARPAPPARRRPAPRLETRGTSSGWVFPVHGESDFGDGFTGAAAGDLGPGCKGGPHEGVDIFAPGGAPVLAVTDGVLFRVGTLPCSGNRLWLRSDDGHTFFYAHMSAFAAGTRNGRRVKAGEVIGFNGATGNARGKPSHLHFEIHPHDGEAIDPYPFLLAWRARRDVPGAAWLARYGNDPGSRPGTLVVVRDFLDRR